MLQLHNDYHNQILSIKNRNLFLIDKILLILVIFIFSFIVIYYLINNYREIIESVNNFILNCNYFYYKRTF
ncbi:MAG: hypothetical protein A2015_09065 [Spirochaetes bacterium GWF1_31_7]|nr:MAG: hypothetical protein A2Y30_09155 [Spirochaetes bacterium GWE1_32_154]OHD46624.1 MAG: hypothetical protein A2Y29_07700 [Spirochaetes bacterium GWE2_31_10]OHD47638.1 MAG: hypothetical protein A2015_09065 [Spirochaetes bacterium GWF1_31_7]